ncbi:ABC transporter ATP-binding protein [Mariniplasma anaerobium]|uniref:Macrolide ABC transporter ATP-binding protein n=1 Tax=Mariniplasma anaerobium TaxID=2735436 RepID=A0A7U9XVQ2_9MOLU|nr:ABC transporter ATP-binding protein [Mariniplasma anaerobium]BCR36625.1 macrolide ABC transporter ATP-binding protein [Mariniplasma anaerobium]
MPQIKVSSLKKSYKNAKLVTEVLRGIDFDVNESEFISIVGPSGSGKSTLLYVLSGLESYDQGEIYIFDKLLTDYTDSQKAKLRSQDIGFVFQFYNLMPNLTTYENVLLASVLGSQKTKQEVMDTLDIVGMKDYKDYYPAQLSGGMQQKVAIARCLINDPKIIFADEPIGNLDYESGKKIMELFKTLNQTYHKTILMVTHNLESTSYGQRTLHMLDGKVIDDEKKSK